MRPLVVALALVALAGCSDPEPPRPGVLVICIDTLRADRVGHIAGEGDLAPAMDALAARGTSFTRTFAPAPFTAPSMATMATGVSPLVHGVRSWSEFGRRYSGPTMAQTFHAYGWQTGFLGANGFLRVIQPVRRGYDTFEDIHDRPGPALTRRALQWIDEAREGEDPWFLWVHYYDPHAPYEHHQEHGERFASKALRDRFDSAAPEFLKGLAPGRPGWGDAAKLFSGLYDGEVAFVDAAIGKLLAGLEERGLTDTTTVVLTSDHGENLADHAPHFAHRDALFDSLTHVPFVLAGPGVAKGRKLDGLAAIEDLPRTVLDLAGVPLPEKLGGRSLADVVRGGEERPAPTVFADAGLQDVRLLMARTATRKQLRRELDDAFAFEAFDMATDPGEMRPLPALPNDPLAMRLEAWIEAETRRHAERLGAASREHDDLSSDELRQLRAFGYLK